MLKGFALFSLCVYCLNACSSIDSDPSIADDLNEVLKCNPDLPYVFTYEIKGAFYQNDSLYVKSNDLEVYSLPVRCKEKRTYPVSTDPNFAQLQNPVSFADYVYSFEKILKEYEQSDSIRIADVLTGKVLWSCPVNLKKFYLYESVLFINEKKVLIEAADLENRTSKNSVHTNALLLMDKECNLKFLGHKYMSKTLSGRKKKALLLAYDSDYEYDALLLVDTNDSMRWIYKSKKSSERCNGYFGVYFSYPYMVCAETDAKKMEAKLQRYVIDGDSLRFDSTSSEKLTMTTDCGGCVDGYIFPCGKDACIFYKSERQIKKLNF